MRLLRKSDRETADREVYTRDGLFELAERLATAVPDRTCSLKLPLDFGISSSNASK